MLSCMVYWCFSFCLSVCLFIWGKGYEALCVAGLWLASSIHHTSPCAPNHAYFVLSPGNQDNAELLVTPLIYWPLCR